MTILLGLLAHFWARIGIERIPGSRRAMTLHQQARVAHAQTLLESASMRSVAAGAHAGAMIDVVAN